MHQAFFGYSYLNVKKQHLGIVYLLVVQFHLVKLQEVSFDGSALAKRKIKRVTINI